MKAPKTRNFNRDAALKSSYQFMSPGIRAMVLYTELIYICLSVKKTKTKTQTLVQKFKLNKQILSGNRQSYHL